MHTSSLQFFKFEVLGSKFLNTHHFFAIFVVSTTKLNIQHDVFAKTVIFESRYPRN